MRLLSIGEKALFLNGSEETMQIRLAGLVPESIVDGPGYRFAVFVQGCPHACPGCHNPKTHDFDGGYMADTDEIIAKLGTNPLVRGVTLTGGEPMMQAEALCEVARAAKEKGLSVWCYTGFTLEALLAVQDAACMSLLRYIDVLVDGPYIARERSLELLYCGSSNQRLIDMQKTIASGAICLFEPDVW